MKTKKKKDQNWDGVELINLDTLAGRLGIHIVTARRYCKEGKIKGVKCGRRWIVTQENFLNFLNGKK